jgi:hypothetical protein
MRRAAATERTTLSSIGHPAARMWSTHPTQHPQFSSRQI